MDFFHTVLRLFPNHLSTEIQSTIKELNRTPEELRIRIGQPPVIRWCGGELLCNGSAVTENDLTHIVLNATNGGFHAAIDSIQKGYLRLSGGCRMGLCGDGSAQGGTIRNIRHITSVCIRIAAEQFGCADQILPQLLHPNFENTMIIAPPGAGKTTLLRELIRSLSNMGYYLGVADERGELSGFHQGKPVFDLGQRTDIMTGIRKQQAAMMLIKTMSPDILAMDEITALQDTGAITEAIGCGVGLLTTLHGYDLSALHKPSFAPIFETNAFQQAILIHRTNGRRSYQVKRLHD